MTRTFKEKGAALLLILGSLVFLTALLLAFMSGVRVDRKSSELYAQASSVRLMSDSVLNLAMAQVEAGTHGDDGSGNRLAWTSQPGMIRSFDTNGNLHRAYKLYSWPGMVSSVFSANDPAESPPANWADQPALFVDLNAPLRDSYPVINPGAIGKVEGFKIQGAPGAIDNAPVMPVYWLYQLQDGTWVVPQSTGNGKQALIKGATGNNPIVARVAFWTDDETAKLNINTASEGQFWDSPRWMNSREMHMGMVQPAKNEYQRYPGHPFTTSLSPVFSGYTSDLTVSGLVEPDIGTLAPFLGSYSLRPGIKRYLEKVYALAPRAGWGGSEGGTVRFAYNTPAVPLVSRRLYADVDELAFQAPSSTTKMRTLMEGTNSSSPLSQEALEELRFFLTANSRAPEVNLFNQPRVSIWPVDDPTRVNPVRQASDDPARNLKDQQSPLDKLLAFCSTIGKGSNAKAYYFNRSDPSSSKTDLSAGSRNLQLYTYLQGFLEKPFPGFGGKFSTKYTSDYQQILTEIFDYIRSTNLVYAGGPNPDSAFNADFLYAYTTPPFAAGGSSGASQRHVMAYAGGDTGGPTAAANKFSQYAAGGQVVPIQGPNGTKGLGNFPTISSMALMFIVRHVSPKDKNGNPNYAWSPTLHIWVKLTEANKATYGVTTVGSGVPECPDIYYKWETLTGVGDYNGGSGDVLSPFDSTLPNGLLRMEAILLVNPFLVSPGYPGTNPDYRIVVEGLNSFTADGNAMGFPASGTLVMSGNFSGPAAGDKTLTGRYSDFAASPGIMTTFLGKNLGTPASPNRNYYPFFAQNEPVVSPTSFAFNGGTLTVKIQTNGHYGNPVETVQTMEVSFPSATFASPALPKPPASATAVDWGGANSGFNQSAAQLTAYAIRNFGDSPDTGGSTPGNLNIASGRYGRFRQDANDGWSNGIWSDRFILPTVMDVSTNVLDPNGTADVVQAVEVAQGDVRMIAGRTVANGAFAPHLNYGVKRSAHSFRRSNFGNLYYGGQPGRFLDDDYYRNVVYLKDSGTLESMNTVDYDPMVGSLCGPGSWPPTWDQGGDWDSGLSRMPDGPFINKPDEGTGQGDVNNDKVPYFTALQNISYFSAVGANRISPNRIMPSPVMFGSLPTGVNAGRPWQTLLFCPNPRAGDNHFAMKSGPADHLILDLFQMPVVEPYAISEPFSTAGKVNMNYRLVPFPYITRSTALRGILKAVKIASVPVSDILKYKGQEYSNMVPLTTKDYRYPIQADETLKAFEERFNGTVAGKPEVFKSATEICDMFLYPANQSNPAIALVNHNAGDAALKAWWNDKGLTGDNMREQPYSVLYPRLTTKSNTFTVHMRVQALTKVKAVEGQNLWNEDRDNVSGEYRGSATFERFIDPNNPDLPDFAVAGGNIDSFYQFRILHTKEFKP